MGIMERLQVKENIVVTPTLFVLSRTLGGDTAEGRNFHQLGSLIKTRFSC
jgi:hypothetical protein